jgi:oligopeptide transport system ATP-binding protein
MAEPLLQVRDLVKHFTAGGGWLRPPAQRVRAVDGVSFDLAAGETLGLVGESGCGKSTTARCILHLLEPTAGALRFEGRDITRAGPRERRALARDMQIVFQDPHASLNPRMTAGAAVGEALVIHRLAPTRQALQSRVVQLLEQVGLGADHLHRYPHEFSAGQRQRIAIARALAVGPKLLVCDEAVSALDVSIQAQVINLLQDLQRQLSLTYLFISHDLAVVKHLSTRVAVMYRGRIVEIAPTAALYAQPLHPYTEALLSAVPVPDPSLRRRRIVLQGELPRPAEALAGCPFHTRCPIAQQPVCGTVAPALEPAADGHWVACHLRRSAPSA